MTLGCIFYAYAIAAINLGLWTIWISFASAVTSKGACKSSTDAACAGFISHPYLLFADYELKALLLGGSSDTSGLRK